MVSSYKSIKDAVITAGGGGTVGNDMVYTAPASGIAAVVLTAKSGELTATARARVTAAVALEI